MADQWHVLKKKKSTYVFAWIHHVDEGSWVSWQEQVLSIVHTGNQPRFQMSFFFCASAKPESRHPVQHSVVVKQVLLWFYHPDSRILVAWAPSVLQCLYRSWGYSDEEIYFPMVGVGCEVDVDEWDGCTEVRWTHVASCWMEMMLPFVRLLMSRGLDMP